MQEPRANRAAIALASAAAIGLAACGGAAPQATTAHAHTAAGADAKAKKPGLELVKGAPRLPGEIESEGGDGRFLTARGSGPSPSLTFQGFGSHGSSRPREAVKTEAFRVADLPRAEIPDPLPPAQAPTVKTEGPQATDLFVDWESAFRSNSMLGRADAYTSVRVSLRGHNLGRLRIGNNEGAVTAGGGGGVYVVCRVAEDAARRFVSARWELLGASGDGSVALTIIDAWFDMSTCTATIARRTRVPLKSLASGIFFGYREACQDCPGRERVVFVTPNPQHIAAAGVGGEATTTLGPLSRVSFPIRKGGGGSVVGRFMSGVLNDWLTSLKQERLAEGDVVAGIDIAQGVEDAEPIAIAYASKTTAPLAPSARPKIRIPQPVPAPPKPQFSPSSNGPTNPFSQAPSLPPTPMPPTPMPMPPTPKIESLFLQR